MGKITWQISLLKHRLLTAVLIFQTLIWPLQKIYHSKLNPRQVYVFDLSWIWKFRMIINDTACKFLIFCLFRCEKVLNSKISVVITLYNGCLEITFKLVPCSLWCFICLNCYSNSTVSIVIGPKVKFAPDLVAQRIFRAKAMKTQMLIF